MKHDLLSDMFCIIKNTESSGGSSCTTPASKVIKEALRVMQKHKYIGNFEFIDDGKGGKFKIELLGKINNCSVIKPRFSIQKDEFITWEKRYLPAVKTGILLITTPKGIMDHYQAEKQKTGGKLLGYVY